MLSRTPIDPQRIRRITGSFSWIDHRLLTDGFLSDMAAEEILLYFFLILVGDKNGVSFYSYDNICQLLKLEVDRFVQVRDQLIDRALIACETGRFQVLQLPERPQRLALAEPPVKRNRETLLLADIFKQWAAGSNLTKT